MYEIQNGVCNFTGLKKDAEDIAFALSQALSTAREDSSISGFKVYVTSEDIAANIITQLKRLVGVRPILEPTEAGGLYLRYNFQRTVSVAIVGQPEYSKQIPDTADLAGKSVTKLQANENVVRDNFIHAL